jgi:hypothetical protein
LYNNKACDNPLTLNDFGAIEGSTFVYTLPKGPDEPKTDSSSKAKPESKSKALTSPKSKPKINSSSSKGSLSSKSSKSLLSPKTKAKTGAKK